MACNDCSFGLPLNPQKMVAVSPDSSFNTAISFITNTNWQGYSGESTMGYLVQMAGLAVQNFLSAATGIVVAIALIRGFARHTVKAIGNFWVDVTRATLYVLLPLSAVLAIVLVGQGVIQNFDGYKDATTIEKLTYDNPKLDAAGNPIKDKAGNAVTETATTQTQTLPMGPVASQESIKELGTNGGGFFNANSAHPYENPTALDQHAGDGGDPADPVRAHLYLRQDGRGYPPGLGGHDRHAGPVLVSMAVLAFHSEQHGNPLIAKQGIDQVATPMQSGGNMEGKETRFGIAASALFAAVTTATSCGAVNSMHDSMTPLGGFVPLFLIQLGRSRARRGWHRHLHDSDFRHSRRVHCRPDDRAHARVSRQENRGVGNEAGLDLHSDDTVCGAVRHCGGRHDDCRHGGSRQSRAHTASAKFCMPSARPATTTAVRSPDSRPIRCSITSRSAWSCGWADSGRSLPRSPSPDRWRPRSACPSPRARCRRTDPCSSRC